MLRWSPAQAAFRSIASSSLAILAYHGVEEPTIFAEHVAYIRRSHHPLEMADFLAALRRGRPLPARSALITFDDGDRSILEHALPVLAHHQVPATAFVVAGLLDSDQPYWWDEAADLARHGGRADGLEVNTPDSMVRTMKRLPDEDRLRAIGQLRSTAAAPAQRRPQLRNTELRLLEAGGITIGDHTLTHPCLDQCDPPKVRTEIRESRRLLTDALGHQPAVFAYPNGNWSDVVLREVREAGYAAAFLFDHRRSPWPPSDRHRVSRLRVSASASVDRLAIILSGLHPALLGALGRT